MPSQASAEGSLGQKKAAGSVLNVFEGADRTAWSLG